MILYHAISSYQMLEVILHKVTMHKREDAILLLPDFIVNKYPNYERIKECGIFKDVYLFPYLQIQHINEESILKDVNYFYNEMVPYDIRSFTEIYVAGAHFYFTLLLIKNKIKYSFFEDAAGMLSRSEELYVNMKVNFTIHANIAEKYGLFNGKNEYIKKIYLLKSAQRKTFSGEMYVDFSVEQTLKNMNFFARSKIIKIFLLKRIFTNADIILLTQHYANLGIMSLEEQKEKYKNLLKKYEKYRIIVKKHPDDTLDYNKIGENIEIIEQVFPSELLPYVFWKKPQYILSFDSTGCNNLRKSFKIIKEKWEYL